MEGSKPRILLVEDDQALASAYQTRMEMEGFSVHYVSDGGKALAAAIEFQPDLILLDLMMPKVSGFDVLDVLRNTPETAKIKIVILSAMSQPKDIDRATSLGADEYLVKSQAILTDVIARIRYHLKIEPTTA